MPEIVRSYYTLTYDTSVKPVASPAIQLSAAMTAQPFGLAVIDQHK